MNEGLDGRIAEIKPQLVKAKEKGLNRRDRREAIIQTIGKDSIIDESDTTVELALKKYFECRCFNNPFAISRLD